MRRLNFKAGLAAGLAALCFIGAARAADDVTVAMDWLINGAHAGFFAAAEKGYYKAENLEVTIARGFGSGDTVKRVASRRAQFGVADTSALISARANDDVPVRIVAMLYDKAGLGLLYLVESGIKVPKDLEGRAIGRSAAGASVNMLPGFLKVNNIDRTKLREVVVDGANYLPLLMSRQVDAVLEQSINIGRFRKAAEAQKLTVKPMLYSDYGLLTYGNAIMTTPDVIQASPDLVRRFVRASIKGLAFAFDNPDEAVGLMRKRNPEVDAEVAKEELLAVKELALTDFVKANGLGAIDANRMTATRDIVNNALSLKRSVPIDQIYAAGFVPAK